MPSGKGQAPARRRSDSVDGITKSPNDADDTLSAVVKTNHLDEDPALERLPDTVRADVEKIMAET